MLDATLRKTLAPLAEARISELRKELSTLTSTFHFPSPGLPSPAKAKKRKMSAKARKAISDAQKRRWAKTKAAASK